MLSLIAPGQHHEPGGEREAGDGENGLPRSPLDVAQRHAELRAEPPCQSDALEQRRLEVRRWFRPHRFRGRQIHRLPHDADHPHARGPGADQKRQSQRAPVHPEIQRRKAEEDRVEIHEPLAHEPAADAADDRAEHDDHERELQIVPADGRRRIAERLQLGDLLALQTDEPRQHRVDHEGGDAQEDDGIGDGERMQHAQLVVEARGGRMIPARVGADGPVVAQQAVDLLDAPVAASAPGARSMQKSLNAPSRL